MSSSPRRSAPDNEFGNNDPLSDPYDHGTMQDITISDHDIVMNEDSGGSQEPQTSMDKSTIRRYSVWITLLAATSISYASLVVGESNNKALSERKWCVAIVGISLLISLGVNACFFFPDCNPCTKVFVSPSSSTGRFIELILSILMLILWCIGLPIIMNPSNNIAVMYSQIINANLYLASWICFGCVFYIVGDLMGDLFGHVAMTTRNRLDPDTGEFVEVIGLQQINYKGLWETRRGKWYALLAITGIALSSSVRTFQAFECYVTVMKANNACHDSTVAVAMTTLGGVLAVVMACVSGMAATATTDNNATGGGGTAQYVERIGAVSTSFVWAIGLIFITFGDGPGHSLGNLFFSTWAAFVISILITADCFRDFIVHRSLIASVVGNDQNDQNQIQLPPAGGDDSDI